MQNKLKILPFHENNAGKLGKRINPDLPNCYKNIYI